MKKTNSLVPPNKMARPTRWRINGQARHALIGEHKMIGKTISHYRILEELPDFVGTGGQGGMPSISKHIIAWLVNEGDVNDR